VPPALPPPDKLQPLPSAVVIGPALRLGSFGVQLVDEELPRGRRSLEVKVVRCDRAGLRLAHRRGGERLARHAGHFAGRHGLIVLIALAESIVAIGVGAEGLDLGAQVSAGALLGVPITMALWWAYIDVVALVAERRMRAGARGVQTRIARDYDTLLHLPMVAGSCS
jgi:low temperature requirement protein LtrA